MVVLAIVGITKLRGGDDLTLTSWSPARPSVERRAAKRENYGDFAGYTCAAQQGDEAEVLCSAKKSVAGKGGRYVDEVTGISVNGDTATATVVYHFEHAADDKLKTPMTFVQQDGDWKVCSPGPH